MKNHICPKCHGEFQRMSKSGCALWRVSLKKVEGTFLLESEARIPELLLQNYEMNVSNARGEYFSFTRGKVRAAQLSYTILFFQRAKEYLLRQPTSIKATAESFSFMVLAEIMTPEFSKRTQSVRGLNHFFDNACSAVYQTKIKEQQQSILHHSIDLSPSFEVKVF